MEAPITAATLTPNPLRFNFPTQAVDPVSSWRPPLYSVPLAISPFDHFYFTRPIAANEVNWPLPDYRYGGIFFKPEIIHTGVDIPAKEGVPVIAAGPGKVVWAGWGLFSGDVRNTRDPYGLAVAIRHDFGYQDQQLYTVYAHMQEIDVLPGQWVDTGEQLGLVGRTGFTTGPHLHFEVRLGKNDYFTTLNPELWLVPPQGWGVLAARVMDTFLNPLPDHEVVVRSLATNQAWTVKTYGFGTVKSDPYYNENMVISDLPAGSYTIMVPYAGYRNEIELQIYPGQVTYFTFQGFRRFSTDLPPTPEIDIPTPSP